MQKEKETLKEQTEGDKTSVEKTYPDVILVNAISKGLTLKEQT